MSSVPVTWAEKDQPLQPSAVAAMDRHAKRLAQRILELDAAVLSRLLGVAGKHTLVVMGAESDLPWVDGVVYLARDSSAPSLLLPTLLAPIVPGPDLLEQALRRKFPNLALPIAVLPRNPTTIIACGQALPLNAKEIEKWLGEGRN